MKGLEGLHIELARPDSYEVIEHFPGHRVLAGEAIRITGKLPPGTPAALVYPPVGLEAPIHFAIVLDEGTLGKTTTRP